MNDHPIEIAFEEHARRHCDPDSLQMKRVKAPDDPFKPEFTLEGRFQWCSRNYVFSGSLTDSPMVTTISISGATKTPVGFEDLLCFGAVLQKFHGIGCVFTMLGGRMMLTGASIVLPSQGFSALIINWATATIDERLQSIGKELNLDL